MSVAALASAGRERLARRLAAWGVAPNALSWAGLLFSVLACGPLLAGASDRAPWSAPVAATTRIAPSICAAPVIMFFT